MPTTSVDLVLIPLGRSSLEAGILVVLVLAAQWGFRRQLAPRWRCALWLLVVARLLLPFSFGSVTSVFNLLPRWTPSNSPPPPVTAPMAPATTVAPAPPPAVSAVSATPMPAFPVSSRHGWSWTRRMFAVWLAGAALLAVHIAVASLRLRMRCAKLRPLTQPAALAVLEECCGRMRLSIQPALLETGEVGSPALYGLFRPRLLLPRGFTAGFSPAELRFVFLHELAHLKRRDLLMNWLMAALQALHWFNPLVWIGFARWRADRELACDAMALEAAGMGQNREYGRTILRLLENFARPMATPGLVGILEDKRQLRRRIGLIADYVPTRGWPRLAVLLLGVLAVIGLTDARSGSPSAADSLATSLAGGSTPADSAGKAAATPQLADKLIGAWGLVDAPGETPPTSGGRIKLFTGTHWCMTQADPKTGVVLFHHGGVYTLKSGDYCETVQYANPTTMNFIGATNGHFKIKIEGDTLTDIGIDNQHREVWKRLTRPGAVVSPAAPGELTGTWVMEVKPGGDGDSRVLGDGLKFCVGGYWCVTQADAKTGVVIIHHGGTYKVKGNVYSESVEYANPVSLNLIGHTFKFTLKLEGDTLGLAGIGNPWNEEWKRAR